MRTLLLPSLSFALAALPAQGAPQRDPSLELSTHEVAMAPPLADAAVHAGRGRGAEQVLFDRPRADEPLWAIGAAWKASFDATGTTVVPFFGSEAPRNFPLRLELASASVGGHALPLADGEPTVVDQGAVHTARGSLTEVIATGLEQLEQSFVFDALSERGELVVDVRIDTELMAAPIDGGVRFANEHGHVDYTKAVAVDAAGRRLPLTIEWTGSGVRMTIPAAFVAEAQLPLVLDPTLNFWFLLGSNPAQLQRDSDVASIQATGVNGRTLIVYRRQWSATDQDCWGILFDGGLGLVATDFAIDFTSQDWLHVAVAGNNYAQNFLVVAEVRVPVFLSSQWYIAGRTVAVTGTPGTVFDIEREGVVGTPGNNFHPDVGSDPYFGVGRYTVVFQKVNGFASDIYMRQVTTAGGLVTTNAVALDASPDEERMPSISKSCGPSNGLQAWWLVTWQRTWPSSPFDQEVRGRFVNWNGALPTGEFGIATSIADETAPSAGSPIDRDGTRYWPMCFETAPIAGQPRDVVCRLITSSGNTQASFTISQGVPGADDREPEIDSDGTRFVTILTTGTPGYPQSIETITTAWLPASNSFRIEERTGMQTSSLDDHGQGNVCADFSGGGAVSPRYFVSFTNYSNNTFNLHNYGGYSGGTFFTTRQTQCGNLSIQVTGSPVIGQTVTATVGQAPFSGTILGFPGYIPLNVLGCNCVQGVDQALYLSNPLVWQVPNDPQFVGITLSVQGWTIVGSQCLGFVDLSDTVDFTIR